MGIIYALIGVQIILIFLTIWIIVTVGLMLFHWNYSLPFIPTNRKSAKKLISLMELQPSDRVIDIGSGWGTLLHHARSSGANLTGIERSPLLHFLTKLRFVTYKEISLIRGDAFKKEYSQYNRVLGWWIPPFVKRIFPILSDQLPVGARVGSYMFKLPDHPKWDVQEIKEGKERYYIANKIA